MGKAWLPLLFVLTGCQTILVLGDATGPRYRLPAVASPSHYDLSIDTNLEAYSFTGQVTIAIQILKPTDTLTLNSKNLTINAVVLTDEKNTPVKTSPPKINEELEFLIITAEKSLPKDAKYSLKVTFSGKLTDARKGYYRSRSIKDGSKDVKYIAVTHFEPTAARYAFPCWDEPSYKATFKISLTHAATYKAISNQVQDGAPTDAGNGKLTTKFLTTPKMSTYLVAFVVSDYEPSASPDGTFRVWTNPKAKAHAKYALNVSEPLLKKLNEFTGIEFSDYIKKMDQIALKDFQMGAMENWGLVTYRERSLLYEEGVTTTRAKKNIIATIAHEFTHQWFGNLVSPKWWTYVWLNEGFADYFEYFITNEVAPEWRLNETFVVDNIQGRAFVADVAENVRPMNKEVDSPDEIMSLFDTIAYQKAGSVIRMMCHILTPQVFKNGLRAYLKGLNGTVADSSDLLNYLQKEADKKWDDGVTIDKIMDEWINQPGYPVVTVKKHKNGTYEVSQEKFVLHGSAKDTKWWVPLTYVTESKADFTSTEPVAWLKPNNETLLIKGDEKKKNEWFIFNTQQTGYYRVNYDKENWQLLANYLEKKNFIKIHVLNRAQLIDDALNMARTNRMNYTDALTLTLYLKNEADYVPWQAAFTNLNFLQDMLRTSDRYDVFKLYLRYIMHTVKKQVGFKPKGDDKVLTKMLRTNVLKWSCRAGEEECEKYARDALKARVANETAKLDVDLSNAIVCAGVRSADQATFNKTYEALAKTEDEDTRKALLSAMGCSKSVEILKNYLLSTLKNDSLLTFDTAVQAVVSEHPQGAQIALDVFVAKYESIKQLKNAENVIQSSVNAIASGIMNKDQLIELSILVAKNGLKADLLQSTVLKASRNIEWLDSHRTTLESWLVAHEDQFNSASSLAFASILVVLSLFITRFC